LTKKELEDDGYLAGYQILVKRGQLETAELLSKKPRMIAIQLQWQSTQHQIAWTVFSQQTTQSTQFWQSPSVRNALGHLAFPLC